MRPAGFSLGASKPDPGPAGEGEGDASAAEETAGAGVAANPLAELLDQLLADLAGGEVARARATVAAIHARLEAQCWGGVDAVIGTRAPARAGA